MSLKNERARANNLIPENCVDAIDLAPFTPRRGVGDVAAQQGKKIRATALAKEWNLESKILIGYAQKLGMDVKDSPLASFTENERDRLLAFLNQNGPRIPEGPMQPKITQPTISNTRGAGPDREPFVGSAETSIFEAKQRDPREDSDWDNSDLDDCARLQEWDEEGVPEFAPAVVEAAQSAEGLPQAIPPARATNGDPGGTNVTHGPAPQREFSAVQPRSVSTSEMTPRQLVGNAGRPASSGRKADSKWVHPSGTDVPDEFCSGGQRRGPVSGTKTELGYALYPARDRVPTDRQLRTHLQKSAEKNRVFVCDAGAKLIEVFFRTDRDKNAAEESVKAFRQKKMEAAKRKRTPRIRVAEGSQRKLKEVRGSLRKRARRKSPRKRR